MADPLDTIARICNEQPHDALTQIADALGYTEQREQERAQREQTLAGLVKRLARRLHPEDPLRVTVTGYLQEQGFFNPLRPAGVTEAYAGWKLVPVELTQGMREAWDTAPNGEDDDENMRAGYRAMLAAAPSAHGVGPSDGGRQK